MCGIIGVYRQENAYKTIVEGLCKLSNRGYDSFGIHMFGTHKLSSRNKYHDVCKVGDIKEHRDNLLYTECKLKNGIGHTRWATHGKVTLQNTHPIRSDCNRVIVVHNGTVSGEFPATDTKAVANMVADEYEKTNPYNAISNVMKDIEGDNAFLFCIENELYVACTGNKRLYVSKNGIISSEGSLLHDSYVSVSKTTRIDQKFLDSIINIPLGEYIESLDTSMMEEIEQQEELFKYEPGLLNEAFNVMSMGKNRVFIGCGSSYNAALFAQLAFRSSGWRADSAYASEIKACEDICPYENDQLIAISQSGETKDVIDVLESNSWNNPTVITNEPASFLANNYNHINIGAGKECAVAATKTFTMTCLKLLQLSQQHIFSRRTFFENILNEIYDKKFISQIIVNAKKGVYNCVEEGFSRTLFLGSRFTYPIALEGALKLKEVSYIPSEGMPAAEIKHGPIALVDSDLLSVFIVSSWNDDIRNNISEIKARGGRILLVSYKDCGADSFIHVPKILFKSAPTKKEKIVNESVHAVLCNIALQVFAHETAIKLGLNPNRPRNLAKTVTV